MVKSKIKRIKNQWLIKNKEINKMRLNKLNKIFRKTNKTNKTKTTNKTRKNSHISLDNKSVRTFFSKATNFHKRTVKKTATYKKEYKP